MGQMVKANLAELHSHCFCRYNMSLKPLPNESLARELVNHYRQFESSHVGENGACVYALRNSQFLWTFKYVNFGWVQLWRIASNFPKFSPATVSRYEYFHAKQHIGTTVLLPARVKSFWWVVDACLIKHGRITIGLLLVEGAHKRTNFPSLGASNVQIQLPHTYKFSWFKSFVKLLKWLWHEC